MKLLRIGQAGRERPAAWIGDGLIVDLSDVLDDIDGPALRPDSLRALADTVRDRVHSGAHVEPLGARRIGAPFARPHQILCIGLNYADHAAEAGQPVPDEPILFTKAPNTLVGPNDDVRLPRGGDKTDWEVELGIVIGSRASYLPDLAAAEAAIAGYTLVNDVSERSFQLERGGQWTKGKSAETFNPAGPWLVTPDEIDDITALQLTLDVNGVRRQSGSTSTMIFTPAHIVHYLSQFLVLEPGDLINTGTPPGVGLGFTPPIWLEEGDVMELSITNLGTQRQRVIAAR